jgi:hydrogenase maturation protein HypF
MRGREAAEIARAFHRSIAAALCRAVAELGEKYGLDTVVLSGGVFQNQLLMTGIAEISRMTVWTNSAVPPNDGGISLGQAALAAFDKAHHA